MNILGLTGAALAVYVYFELGLACVLALWWETRAPGQRRPSRLVVLATFLLWPLFLWFLFHPSGSAPCDGRDET